jgi:TRAP-type C4-dicarboxylate transport system substrate-binding protein
LKKLLFIALAAVLALSVSLVACTGEGPVVTPWDSQITLTLHLTMPPEASLWKYVYQPWVWAVQNLTGTDGGTFQVQTTFGSEPWAEADALESIGNDVTDLGQINGEQFKLGTIGYIPFLWNMEECAWATFNLFNTQVADWDATGELDKVKILVSTPLQPAQLWTTDHDGGKNVTTLADLAGMNIRSEDPEAPTISALGANPVLGYEADDLPGILNAGTVAGCFFTYSAWSFGIVDATNYTTQVNLMPRVYVLGMNKAKYNALPPDAQTALDSVCTGAESVALAKAHDDGQGYGICITKGFCNLPWSEFAFVDNPRIPYVLPPSELANWEAACAPVHTWWIGNMTADGFDGQGIYDEAVSLIATTPPY